MNKNILVPIDFTEKSLKTLEQAFGLAKLLNSDITLLHVRQDTKKTMFFSFFSEEESLEMKKKYLEKLHLKLKDITKDAYKRHKVKINAMLSKGRPFEKIMEIAETINAALIFIDRNTAEGNTKDYIGTNASRIIRHSQCPVLINNDAAFDYSKGFKNIILPIDLTEGSMQKVNNAIELAKFCNSNIRVVSESITNDKQKASKLQILLNQVDKYLKNSGVNYTIEQLKNEKKNCSFSRQLFDYSKKKKYDLFIIMTQEEVALVKSYILPSTLELIRNSEIPVITIVPKDINFMIPAY